MTRATVLRRPALWLGLVLWCAVLAAVLVVLVRRPPGPALAAPLGLAPRFTLVDMDGAPLSSDMLRGAPYVADFIFTRCQSVCPVLTARMAELQRRSAAQGLPVPLVSFSVDPTYDTPERLRAYAERAGADPSRWHFVTGEREAMRRVVVDGFGTVMQPSHRADPAQPNDLVGIAHASRFVVVDAEGQIRGFFETSDAGLDAIVRLLRRLRAEYRS